MYMYIHAYTMCSIGNDELHIYSGRVVLVYVHVIYIHSRIQFEICTDLWLCHLLPLLLHLLFLLQVLAESCETVNVDLLGLGSYLLDDRLHLNHLVSRATLLVSAVRSPAGSGGPAVWGVHIHVHAYIQCKYIIVYIMYI